LLVVPHRKKARTGTTLARHIARNESGGRHEGGGQFARLGMAQNERPGGKAQVRHVKVNGARFRGSERRVAKHRQAAWQRCVGKSVCVCEVDSGGYGIYRRIAVNAIVS